MGSTRRYGSRAAKLAFMAAAVVLLGVLMAAPAMAVPLKTTSLTATANTTTVTYGHGAIVNAVLTDTSVTPAVPVGGEWVRVEQSASASGPWSLLYVVTASSGASYSGTYAAAVLPLQTTYYEFVYEGAGGMFPTAGIYAGSTSNVLKVAVKPVLGRPSCPSMVKKNHSFTVKGSVMPGSPAGPAVKIKVYRLKGTKWATYKTYTARVSGIKYSHRMKIAAKGMFKFRAFVYTSSQFAGTHSSLSKMLTVR
jgi:hypothetical protein